MNYLEKFKEKCRLDDNFIEKINFLFEKLVNFGYLDNLNVSKLSKKLYNNVDAVFLSSDKTHDYKTGYYDAIKKELYIKDSNDLESMFLRIIYAITTTQKDDNTFYVGYSKTSLAKSSYKQVHTNFGLNRAVVSNLVCRLLYTEPKTLSIVPTYRTYTNDFLGNGITTDNNIYFLEGQILKQICYTLNIEEEDLYYHLFLNPSTYFSKILKKNKVDDPEKLLKLFDKASKNYSNYNKLLYYNKLLDENFISSKKTLPDEKVNDQIIKEKENLIYQISREIYKIRPELEDDDNEDLQLSLSETMNQLEEKIIKNIVDIQNILVKTLLDSEIKYSPIEFTIKQKQLSKMLIFTNKKLEDSIFNTISYKVLNTFENSSSNLIEKIKYSIASEVLSSEKYTKIYNKMDFNRLDGLNLPYNTEIIALSVDGTFLQLLKIKDLDLPFKKLKDNTEIIKIDNLKFLLNSPISIKSTQDIEKIYTYLKNEKYKDLNIENTFITNINNTTLIIVISDENFEIYKMDIINDKVKCNTLKMSEKYEVFNTSNISYSDKKYKNQATNNHKILGY